MSSSPVPGSTSSSPVPNGSSDGDWRGSVQQSARNGKVREIAGVLASLEPGASATSKLRLAMQFEDTVFKGAVSLEDYQKKLTKRLKKLQKNYVPTQPAGATEKERTIEQLRQTHGASIQYVIKNAQKAVQEMTHKHGAEKGKQLEQHLDAAKIWAHDLGLLGPSTKPNYHMPEDQLSRLKSNIERRLENVRAHVVKLADPDRFFVETLDKAEQECKTNPQAAEELAQQIKRRYLQIFKNNLEPESTMTSALEQTARNVPLPTNSATSAQTATLQKQKDKAALIYLEKMRAASSAFLAFMALPDKSQSSVPISTGVLKKMHAVVLEGTDYVVDVIKDHRKRSQDSHVTLQDAWMKHLELPTPTATMTRGATDDPTTSHKRPRTGRPTVVLQSRILLTPGRKTPPILIPEFKRKGATLVRPPPTGEGSHLILNFENAFTMTIYLVPLLVEIRACEPQRQETKTLDETNQKGESSSNQSTRTKKTLLSHTVSAPWTPLYHGLTRGDDEGSTAQDDDASTSNILHVWNVKGDYDTIGFVAQERLRDASAHATYVLRTCFANSHAKMAAKTSNDFEVEILEGQALRDFLQLVRTTYSPNWNDIV